MVSFFAALVISIGGLTSSAPVTAPDVCTASTAVEQAMVDCPEIFVAD